MSWVDGQVVTDWAAEIAKREQAHRRLSERRRSGRAREVRVPQRPESAARVELVPRQPGRVQRRAVRAVQDDARSRSESSESDAARHRPDLEARGDRAGGRGSAGGSVDARSHRRRAEPVRLRRRRRASAGERQSPLPFGFAFENPRAFEPLSAAEPTALDGRLLARRVFQNTSLLIAKLRRPRSRGELGERPAGLRQPGSDGPRVLLVRGLPRRPRDGRREDEVPSRHAEHRDRSAVPTRSC